MQLVKFQPIQPKNGGVQSIPLMSLKILIDIKVQFYKMIIILIKRTTIVKL